MLNVELGISSILICAEMVVFATLHVYSFSYLPYVIPGVTTPITKSLRDGFNPMDMVREIIWACHDTVLLIQGKPIPVRDGRLEFKLKRAHTIRARRRNPLFRSRKPTGATGPVDPKLAAIYQATLESEDALDAAGHEEQARAGLLANADGKRPFFYHCYSCNV